MTSNHQPTDTRLNYDEGTYEEKLKRTVAPGVYYLNTPYNDCKYSEYNLPADPAVRFQNYGHSMCSMKTAIDDSSELRGLNYKNSKCNTDGYLPNSYTKTSECDIKYDNKFRQFFTPQESTRLSNPVNTLKETGINRWEWLTNNPQNFVSEQFNRVPTNYRMVAKDNHVPLIEIPQNDDNIRPSVSNSRVNPGDNIHNWAKGLATHRYAPGYPDGAVNYNIACK